ncbi:MAG: thymidylate synthase [Parachlamydiales bacterium]|jgi:thymidylate synthase
MGNFFIPRFKIIKAQNLDDLIKKAIKFIKKRGKYINTRSGSCQQSYGITYVLLNSRNRIHWLRYPNSIRYLTRELLAYFDGSLNINDGLLEASSFWKKVANDKDYIFSNYGYYVFYQKVKDYKSQYDWALERLLENPYTRRAMININQVFHKISDVKDFPCTISLHFFIVENTLYCSVFARSSDIYYGLPYDIGFFSFVQELLYQNLKQKDPMQFSNLKLGPTFIKTLFTQIYDFSRDRVLEILNKKKDKKIIEIMPAIDDAELVLNDIYNHSANSQVMKWIYEKCNV